MQHLISLILKYKKVYISVIVVYVAMFVLTAYTLATKTGGMAQTAFPTRSASASEETTTARPATQLPSSFRGTKPNALTYADALAPLFQRMHQGEAVRILQIGDSHVRGNYLPHAVGAVLQQQLGTGGLEGIDLDVAPEIDGGITFDYLAQNGAHASRYCESDKLDDIAAFRPDLVIISFGTNEAHGHFDSDQHIATLKQLTESIAHRCPGVHFLLTTPPGSYITTYGHRWRDRRGRWHYNTSHGVNPRTETVARAIDTFAKQNNCALWNLFEIAGGATHATTNWRNAGLMQNDCIHYTAEAYTLQGTLLGEAIVQAYEQTETKE
ncbi:MAG: GDSL-type esterase/lipase family protein [Bacteroidales bacterium]|nr:GDSL-type esterase/lipase family protein [Bacteroidales bacterium]